MERILGVRLELRQLTAQVLCELPEIVDHEVDLRLLMREADQPLFIKSWRTHDVVVDRPEEGELSKVEISRLVIAVVTHRRG